MIQKVKGKEKVKIGNSLSFSVGAVFSKTRRAFDTGASIE